MENNLTEEKEYTLKDMIDVIVKKWIMIAGFSIISGIIVSVVTLFVVTPKYSTNAKYYAADSASHSLGTNSSELMYLQKLVDTYIQLFNTEKFYDNIIVCSGVELSTSELKQMISVTAEADTSIFNVTVSGSDVDTIMRIQDSISEFAPEMVTSVTKSGRVVLCDPAKIPLKPSSPNQMRNTIAGLLAGFVVGFFIALISEHMNQKVKRKKDIEMRFELPVLSQIPSFKYSRKKISDSKKQSAFLCDDNNINQTTGFVVKEAYKMLRTNLRYISNMNECKKIVITSASSHEGKSVTAINLASAIAETGSKVLIIDGDMRKGQVHSYLKIRNRSGLSNLLMGSADLNSVVIKSRENKNLFIITCGTIHSNPSELAASEQMAGLMDELSEMYDYIIIDSPSINLVSDPIPFSKISDGTIMVVRCGMSIYGDIHRALDSFNLVETNIIGFVLNDVPVNKKWYYQNKDAYIYLASQENENDANETEIKNHSGNTVKLKRQKQLR